MTDDLPTLPLSIRTLSVSSAVSDLEFLQHRRIVLSTFLSGDLDGVKSVLYNDFPLTILRLETLPSKSPALPLSLPILGLGEPELALKIILLVADPSNTPSTNSLNIPEERVNVILCQTLSLISVVPVTVLLSTLSVDFARIAPVPDIT